MVVFFFLGFLAAPYLKLDITAIALFGTCLAIIIYVVMNRDEKSSNTQAGPNDFDNLTEGEIDFE